MSNGIRNLNDAELLLVTKSLVEREREITTEVLWHLEEIERRKLYADWSEPLSLDTEFGGK